MVSGHQGEARSYDYRRQDAEEARPTLPEREAQWQESHQQTPGGPEAQGKEKVKQGGNHEPVQQAEERNQNDPHVAKDLDSLTTERADMVGESLLQLRLLGKLELHENL